MKPLLILAFVPILLYLWVGISTLHHSRTIRQRIKKGDPHAAPRFSEERTDQSRETRQ
jgi:hypothetical protein